MNGIPDGVFWNGPQNVKDQTLMCFTELQTGRDFTLPPPRSAHSDIQAAALIIRAEAKAEAEKLNSFPPDA